MAGYRKYQLLDGISIFFLYFNEVLVGSQFHGYSILFFDELQLDSSLNSSRQQIQKYIWVDIQILAGWKTSLPGIAGTRGTRFFDTLGLGWRKKRKQLFLCLVLNLQIYSNIVLDIFSYIRSDIDGKDIQFAPFPTKKQFFSKILITDPGRWYHVRKNWKIP